jgi:tetratricopeptide (TPR) repeat protein
LTLAELYQSEDRFEDAIEVVEQLEPTTYAAVSLAELYVAANRYPDVIELTDGIENTDDATALLCVFRGVAFREQGFHDAAHEAFKQALRSRSRAAAIRHLALSERATNYAAQGKKGMARKDLERILAEDSSFEGVKERLDELSDCSIGSVRPDRETAEFMCGRFTSSQRREAIGERFEVAVPETYRARYNLAPQQRTPGRYTTLKLP